MQINEQEFISTVNDHKLILQYEGDNIYSIISEVNGEEIVLTLTREELFDISLKVFPNLRQLCFQNISFGVRWKEQTNQQANGISGLTMLVHVNELANTLDPLDTKSLLHLISIEYAVIAEQLQLIRR